MSDNLILLTDSYKVSHFVQYPAGTQAVYSYLESRGGLYPETTVIGLQYMLKKYFTQRVTNLHIMEAQLRLEKHFGSQLWNLKGWQHIVKDHGGYLPLEIKSVPEGTTVPTSNILMSCVNTCPHCYWLTNYVETLLVQNWYPITVASMGRAIRARIKHWYDKTADDYSGLAFGLHDFGFRGVSSVESAGWGGFAHLVHFMGTDTLEALDVADRYYFTQDAGFSIPAAEHSTITSWGREREVDAYRNMLTAYPEGPVAVVSDSWDIFNACERLWGGALRDMVLNRNGRVVIRPDSGDPIQVVPKVLQILGDKFGTSTNSKGFKVLHPNVRVIQGDGVDPMMIAAIYNATTNAGFSAENVCFGMGGALLQKLNRDTQKFAFKCAAIKQNGIWTPVYKDPVTDPGKRSKAGLMKLVKTASGFETRQAYEPGEDQLRTMFKDGKVMEEVTLNDIRIRAGVLQPQTV